jgi:hypothetical protein
MEERDVKVALILTRYGKPKIYMMGGQWWASTKGTCGGSYTPAGAYNMWLNMVARKDRTKWEAIRPDDRFLHRPFTNESEGTRIVRCLPVKIGAH